MRAISKYRKYIDTIVLKYYKSYKSFYVKGGYEIEDLKQEASILFDTLVRDHSEIIEEIQFRGFLAQGIAWLMWTIKNEISLEFRKHEDVKTRSGKYPTPKPLTRKIPAEKQTYTQYLADAMNEDTDHYTMEELPRFVTDADNIDSLEFRMLIDDAKEVLTKREFEIFILMGVEGYSSIELEKMLKVSRSAILRTKDRAGKKLKNNFLI